MKISIITATFNSAATVADCIASVNNQTFQNIEHIIIDGASKDNTLEIIKNTPNRITCIVSEPDKGIYDAMNKGIRLATGDIIGILNSDDLYNDMDVLEKVSEKFRIRDTECIHADLFYVNKENINQIVRHWKTCEFSPGAFKKGWHPAHPTFFVKKEVYEKYGLFNLNFRLAADFELMLRLLERYKISSAYFPDPFVRMRLGGATSKNISNIVKQNIECFNAFKINGIRVSLLYPFYRIIPKFKQFFNKQVSL
jgi:glycosyltransferase involved in cell wall biosynthesis